MWMMPSCICSTVCSQLDTESSAVRLMVFQFSSTFNTRQLLLQRDKLWQMGVDSLLVSWITDSLTERPPFVRLRDCSSGTVVSSICTPQGIVLSPVLFTLYIWLQLQLCSVPHVEVFWWHSIVECIRDRQEGGVQEPTTLRREMPADWTGCWWKYSTGTELESLTSVAENRTLNKLLSIIDNDNHPLHSIVIRHRSMFSGIFLSLTCSTDRLRKSFVPQAIQLFNSTQ